MRTERTGLIDVDKFLEELKYKKGITFQYFFATERSIKYRRGMSKEMFMIEELVKEMALILINEKGISMMQALDAIYNSDTYSSLINLKSGLYSQSTAYVYEYLDKELSTGSMI